MDTESEAGDCDDEEALFKTYLHLRKTARSGYFNASWNAMITGGSSVMAIIELKVT